MAGWHFQGQNGEDLYCDEVSVEEIITGLPKLFLDTNRTPVGDDFRLVNVDLPTTPVYVYSARAIQENVKTYLDAMKEVSLAGSLGYAVKANGNLKLLEVMKSSGVEMLVTVSGNEVLAGLQVGFEPDKILLNGNGKQDWEIKLAVEQGVLLNVDSPFDACRITDMTLKHARDREVNVLLRVRPSSQSSMGVDVHPYINTAESSKFGMGLSDLDECLSMLSTLPNIRIIGLHCHLGSCILDPNIYKHMTDFMTTVMNRLKAKGITIQLFDVGGGISVDYNKPIPGFNKKRYSSAIDEALDKGSPAKPAVPTIKEFIQAIASVVPPNIKVLIEPGRSLVANSGIILTKVIGQKMVESKQYMIIDAAMTELIRPPLYGAFHQILPIKLDPRGGWSHYDVAGPVCESADILGRDILLPTESSYLAIMDCGAYAASMGSNYNMRPKPAEVLVTGGTYKCIRGRQAYYDLTI